LYHEVQQGLLHVYLLNMTFLGSGCPSGWGFTLHHLAYIGLATSAKLAQPLHGLNHTNYIDPKRSEPRK